MWLKNLEQYMVIGSIRAHAFLRQKITLFAILQT